GIQRWSWDSAPLTSALHPKLYRRAHGHRHANGVAGRPDSKPATCDGHQESLERILHNVRFHEKYRRAIAGSPLRLERIVRRILHRNAARMDAVSLFPPGY